jgi:SM-20-related protein
MPFEQPPSVRKVLISGRELFICDNFVDNETALHIGQLLKTLSFRRSEKSRPDTPVSGAAAEISDDLLANTPFFAEMRRLGEDMFPKERFKDERVYVNSSIFGDMYYIHRDCDPALNNVTVLYYGNIHWHGDWGGETIFYNDQHDAELAVTPRPGRFVVSRGAILHRGGVPARMCLEERLTVAYKLIAI